ncbi:MAG: hypothetical protein IKW77_03670 [Salinivirgaceae bacterium]|nr:hypothetical protein [Salinivirgaceae bacterium]
MTEVVERRFLFYFQFSPHSFYRFTFYNYYGTKIDILLEFSTEKYYLNWNLRVFITDWKILLATMAIKKAGLFAPL